MKATRGDQTGTDNRLLDGFVCATDARTGWTGIDTPTPLINSALPTPAATTTCFARTTPSAVTTDTCPEADLCSRITGEFSLKTTPSLLAAAANAKDALTGSACPSPGVKRPQTHS